MRLAAIRETMTNSKAEKPSMETILEFDGLRMDCAVKSTPHANTQAYNSTYEGASLIQRFEEDGPNDTRARRAQRENRQAWRYR